MAHVPEVKVLTALGDLGVPVTAESTLKHIRLKVHRLLLLLPVHEWKPEYQLEQLELVCCDKDAAGPDINQTTRPRDDDETVESLWSDWDNPRRKLQVALWIKERNTGTGEWESAFFKMLEMAQTTDDNENPFGGHTI